MAHGTAIRAAAARIAAADALLIGAGAGMSADSGIPVYRGPSGRYTDPHALNDANAEQWLTDPHAAALRARARYTDLLAAAPHRGYAILDRWRRAKPHGAFVHTSNVDGMFTRAGFPDQHIYEVHGTYARSQCLTECQGRSAPVFATPDPTVAVASCPFCGGVARPNALLFGDYAFNDTHRETQWANFGRWFDTLPDAAQVVVVEIGAGNDIRTVRTKCETFAASYGWPLVRINPTEPDLPAFLGTRAVAVPLPARTALEALAERLR